MTEPDFEGMTKDEIVTWFKDSDDISAALTSMVRAIEPTTRPASGVPMLLASIRLPAALVEQLDNLADLQGVRRSDVIREALTAYVAEHTSPVGRDEAERALDVLRRVVASRTGEQAEAA